MRGGDDGSMAVVMIGSAATPVGNAIPLNGTPHTSTAPRGAGSQSSQEPIVRLVGINKSFGSQHVLHDISASFPRHLTTVVMGPSGCGKSVMLKHIVGLLRPESGEVWFEETRVDRLPEREMGDIRRKVGYLFQQSALFDSMTVHDNIAFPLVELTSMSAEEREDRIDAVLATVGLTDSARKMPGDLSGGQRKRAALARAIVLEPQLVLYDEPTTGLDPIRSDLIGELILRLKTRLGITGIVVTHDLALAFKVADRMIMLYDGRVLAQGTTAEIRATGDARVTRFLRGEASPEELATIESAGASDDRRRNHRAVGG